ncbi:MAG: hypothetical protein ABR504_06615, partial [Paracoccaceae bacterium]
MEKRFVLAAIAVFGLAACGGSSTPTLNEGAPDDSGVAGEPAGGDAPDDGDEPQGVSEPEVGAELRDADGRMVTFADLEDEADVLLERVLDEDFSDASTILTSGSADYNGVVGIAVGENFADVTGAAFADEYDAAG